MPGIDLRSKTKPDRMKRQILFSAQELHRAQDDKACIVVDCRFNLGDTGAGCKNYLEGHIPSAVYAHLDDDLSSPVESSTGRHPLPNADKFAAFLANCGWQPGDRLVAYDNAGGAIAARLWWLMKYFGHDCAGLLDGGIAAWQAAGFELESGHASIVRTTPVGLGPRNELVVPTSEILRNISTRASVLVDVRASERYRGETEPLDSVAGHIPGSINYPLQLSLSENGRFKSKQEIRDGLLTLFGSNPAKDTVYMCGSGVTACHSIFAAELAGLGNSRIYAGSWSEWIRNAAHPVENQAG